MANIAVNMSMFASILDNSLSFQCADLVARLFSCETDYSVSLGGSVHVCNLTGLNSGSLFYSHSQRYIDIEL